MPASVRAVEAALNTTAAVVVPRFVRGWRGDGALAPRRSGRLTLTELAPAGAQGRVHAVQLAITESLLVVPVLVAGLATAVAGARVTLAVVGIIAVVTLFAMELRRVPAPVPGIEPLEPSPFPAQEGTSLPRPVARQCKGPASQPRGAFPRGSLPQPYFSIWSTVARLVDEPS